jgi:tetratricopeptide (TPR) repeat protein
MALDRNKVARSAEKLVARGKLNAAIEEYRKLLTESANDTTTLNRVGDLYARLNRLDKATALFKKTADHFIDEGFFVKAIAIYKKIIRLDPAQIEVYELLADLYSRQGLVNESRSQYQVVADYYQKHGNVDAAIGVYGKLIELEPDNPSHRLRLAEQLRQSDRPKEAVVQFREIASLFLAHGRADDAVKLFSAALDVDATDLGFITDALLELKDAGHPEAAERLLAAAVERNPAADGLGDLVGFDEARPARTPPVEEQAEPAADAEIEMAVETAVEAVQPSEAEAAPSEVEVEDEEEDILVLALDDEELSAELGPSRTELLPHSDLAAEVEPEIEIDLAGLDEVPVEEETAVEETVVEEKAAEAAAAVDEELAAAQRLEELLLEAETLAKFGLADKAAARLEEAITLAPERAEAYDPLLSLYLDRGETDKVIALGERLAEKGAEGLAVAAWEMVRRRLREEGYSIQEGRLLPPAAEVEVAPEEPVEPERSVVPKELVEPEPSVPLAEAADWLQEKPADGESVDSLFRAEEEFFDLASELEDELRRDGALEVGEELLEADDEQSVEEIVEGFKQGMAETLSEEDYDTHYNLGIAYREMGLVDEAIGEFQLAAKDPRYLVDCCSLLAASFVDKGFPELAVKWYLRGLESPSLAEEEGLGLLYELGSLHLSLGEEEKARDRFVEIYGINSNYRDVVAKLQELDATDLI